MANTAGGGGRSSLSDASAENIFKYMQNSLCLSLTELAS